MIHVGDCIEVMAGMPADSVDAVVTDPPYGLEFMGKGWDRLGDDPVSKSWDTKGRKENVPTRSPDDPGGRHAVHYKQINPRCGNCGRAVQGRDTAKGFRVCSCDNPQWYQPNTLMIRQQHWHEAWGREALRVTRPGGYLLAFGGTRTHHRLVCGLEDAGWIIRDELTWVYASGFPKGKANLKPAHEPIVLARKPGPLRPLGIDAGRIGTETTTTIITPKPTDPSSFSPQGGNREPGHYESDMPGRWPSNLLLSDPALFDEPNPEVVGSGATAGGSGPASGPTLTGESTSNSRGKFNGVEETPFYGDTGGYSRFFLIPKAGRSDREPVLRGQLEPKPAAIQMPPNSSKYERADGEPGLNLPRENAHPTVKPVDLMRHLVRLVTPPGGTVLDCFLGSGTTAIACELEGFPWIGIEQDASYVEIANARLNGVQRGLGLDVAAPSRRSIAPSATKGSGAVVSIDTQLLFGMAGPAEGDEVA